jgi:glycosyltransferase involved in cell wall biosynthesis
MQAVAVFTDTYLPTVNGVTYTIQTWRDRWKRRGGRMPVVYPDADGYRAGADEYPVPSVSFPFYDGFRFGLPGIPDHLDGADLDVVHTHTPFALGLAGRRLADRQGIPLVTSYHTPAREYAHYLSDTFDGTIRRVADRYERWYFGEADAVVAPSRTAAEQIEAGETPIHVVSNGVDTDRFQPADDAAVSALRERYDLPDGPLVGYTGRHGYEKRLRDLLSATEGVDVTVAIAGDGPARDDLERRAAPRNDVSFLGFLDREELPAFYSALDAFAFPSPVETQGLVALEAIACGTPVVAVDSGALSETIVDGETGYHYPRGDIAGFRSAIHRTLEERAALSERCLDRRPELGVEHSIDELRRVYGTVS